MIHQNSNVRDMLYIAFIAICSIITGCHGKVYRKTKFVPYTAKVISYDIDKIKQGGVYYQNINLNNKKRVTANGFSAVIDGQKTWIIDYIAIGDSIVRNTFDSIYVYRKGSETYLFTYNPYDFR
ncbi:MAG: hypothetical protein J6Y72_05575 [Bacteroidales bacterium]|nr:hypothetical protein [Bacteroidales bacterium]